MISDELHLKGRFKTSFIFIFTVGFKALIIILPILEHRNPNK
jgi:hypothetical protein